MIPPKNISETIDFIHTLHDDDLESNLKSVNNLIEQISRDPKANPEIIHLLQEYKATLERCNHLNQESEIRWFDLKKKCHDLRQENEDLKFRCLKLENKNSALDQQIKALQLLHCGPKSEQNSILASNVKAYKNLYIFLLSHPKNHAAVSAEILSRMNYLDKMTRDVIFIMPGYKTIRDDLTVVNNPDTNLQFGFDENVFIEIIQDLEDKSNGKFLYKDACELVFIGVKQNGEYDFNSLTRLDLNFLASRRNIDPISLILSVAQQFRTEKEAQIDVKKYIWQILGELTIQEKQPAIKVFIAGAKKLKIERSLIREELSKVENTHDIDIRSLTFEDFATSLTGQNRGRQTDYNLFIEKDANAVIFIFDTTAGEITEEEFNIAYNSLMKCQHPDIFVYVRKPNLLRRLLTDNKLRNIKNRIFAYQKEYYVEYESLEDLRYLFYSDMTSYFLKWKNKNESGPTDPGSKHLSEV